jgi:phenylacetate-CoA oxygenase PaaI subunit
MTTTRKDAPTLEDDALDAASPWRDFVLAWADDEIMTAYLLGEVLSRYAEIEEMIALGSIAQDDLAHGTMLYSLLVPDARERDRLFFERPTSDFRNAVLAEHDTEDWAAVVLRQHLYEAAERLRLQTVAGLDVRPLSQVAQAMLTEEDLHQAHWEHWCEVLAETPAGREHLQRAVNELMPLSADLFSVSAPDGVEWDRDGLRAAWQAEVSGFVADLGLTMPEQPPASAARGAHTVAFADMHGRWRRVYEQDPTATWG